MTYIKRIPKRQTTGNREFTYTSEMKKMASEGAAGEEETEYLARVDTEADFIIDDLGFDRKLLAGSSFARETLHIIRANSFNPWTILEKYPTAIGFHEVYIIYGVG